MESERSQLQSLLSTWEDARAHGQEVDLTELCAGDSRIEESLRRRIAIFNALEQVLGHSAESGGDAPKLDWGIGSRNGAVLGKYRLLRKIGEGGFGVVYEAERTDGYSDNVAVKILRRGVATETGRARFAAEGQALARVRHPNIATVLDADVTDDGVPYLAMDLIRGCSITDYCVSNSLPISAQLRLALDACDAIGHAHTKGVIHRDLKPSNIMVNEINGRAVLKVIDFGIARFINPTDANEVRPTLDGELVGTTAYMSPEQLGVHREHADTRADIYSIGVVLYELLSGFLPYQRTREERLDAFELQRRMSETGPRALESRPLKQIASPCTRPSRAPNAKGVSRELNWIVMKCLEIEPARRYQTCRELADDIRRYVDNKPVAAGPQSKTYLVRKFVHRNRLLVGTGFVVLLMLSISTAATAFGLWRAVKGQELAERAADQARASAEDARWEQYIAMLQAANAALLTGDAIAAKKMLTDVPAEHVDWEFRYLRFLADSSAYSFEFGFPMYSVCFDATGDRLFASGGNGAIARFDRTEIEQPIVATRLSNIYSIDQSPDGRRLAIGRSDGVMELLDPATLEPINAVVASDSALIRVCFINDQTIVSAARDGSLRGWTVGECIDSNPIPLWHVKSAEPVFAIAFHQDALLLGDESGQITVLDPANGMLAEAQRVCIGRIHDIEIIPGTDLAAVGTVEGEICLIRINGNALSEGVSVVADTQQGNPITELAIISDSSTLLAATHSGAIACFSLPGLEPLESRYGHEGRVYSVATHPSTPLVASASTDGTVRVWEYSHRSPRSIDGIPPPSGLKGRMEAMDVSLLHPAPPIGISHERFLAALSRRGTLHGSLLRTQNDHCFMSFDQSDSTLVCTSKHELGTEHRWGPTWCPIRSALSFDGRMFASLDDQGIVWFGPIAEAEWAGRKIYEWSPDTYPVLAASPDCVAIIGHDGRSMLWRNGLLTEIDFNFDGVSPVDAALSPNSRRLAVTLRPTNADALVLRVYDTFRGRLLLTLDANLVGSNGIWFSEDGDQVVLQDWTGRTHRYTAGPMPED